VFAFRFETQKSSKNSFGINVAHIYSPAPVEWRKKLPGKASKSTEKEESLVTF
jgi:hypothetical protein